MPMPAPRLYTIGYEKRGIDEYVELLVGARVGVVIDVRETAWSYKPGFSKTPLAAALAAADIAYVHAAFAGNPKAFRRAAATHADCLALYAAHVDGRPGVLTQLEAVVAEYAAAGRAAALTCFERHPGDCHRGILAAQWVAHPGRRVEHLAPDGCARLVVEPGGAPLRRAAAARAALGTKAPRFRTPPGAL